MKPNVRSRCWTLRCEMLQFMSWRSCGLDGFVSTSAKVNGLVSKWISSFQPISLHRSFSSSTCIVLRETIQPRYQKQCQLREYSGFHGWMLRMQALGSHSAWQNIPTTLPSLAGYWQNIFPLCHRSPIPTFATRSQTFRYANKRRCQI